MASTDGFFNLYRHGFARVALATPLVRIGDPMANAEATLALMRAAAKQKAIVAVFPELGLSAYSCEDLFHQQALLRASEEALAWLLVAEQEPAAGRLRRAAGGGRRAALQLRGAHLPGAAARRGAQDLPAELPRVLRTAPVHAGRGPGEGCRSGRADRAVRLPDFQTEGEVRGCRLFAEICEDLWVPAPPSSYAALAGATVIANLSASNVVIGKHQYRRDLAANQSARCIAAYLYSAAGAGESTTDLAWDGHAMAYENGSLLAESQRFSTGPQLTFADLDLERLEADRMRQNSFGESMRRHAAEVARFRTVDFSLPLPKGNFDIRAENRKISLRPRRPGDARRALRGGLPHPGGRPRHAPARNRAPKSSSSASRAGWTRPRRCSSARARWTSSGCRGRTSSPTPCRASPPPRAPAPAPGS